MEKSLRECMKKRVERTRGNLAKNRIDSYFVESREQVIPLLKTLLTPEDTVTVGGSVTLDECGIPAFLAGGDYKYLDRYDESLTRDQVEEIFRAAFSADAYICSANAVTEQGEIYNVDGNSNRVAAILYGPKSVIMVCGWNKIVRDLDQAVLRVKNISAPSNAARLSCDTYCATAGRCVGDRGGLADGCACDGRICCNYVVSAKQRHPGRMKVVFVGEELGY